MLVFLVCNFSQSTMHMAYCLSIVKAIWHQMFDEEMSPLSDEETSDMAITIRNSTLVDGHGLRVIAHQLVILTFHSLS